MRNDSELRTYEDVRRILTAVLDFVARREVQEETRRHDDGVTCPFGQKRP